jgi:polysaccharide export outer membrane protein
MFNIKSKKALNCLFLFLLFTSCASTRKSIYFSNLTDTLQSQTIALANFTEPLIQNDDILSVNVQTTDPTVTSTLNLSSGSQPEATSQAAVTGGGQATVLRGYLVNKNGEIELPIIGKVSVAGLTTFQAAEQIKQKAAVYYKLPTVEVRFSNFKVSALGEVNKPGVYILPNEKVSILDAISLAGDLTIYGRRDNILVIRDNGGKKEVARLNINSSDIFKSPFYYLKQGDVVYVEPIKAKINSVTNADAFRYTTLGISILTLISLLFVRFK